MLFRQGDTSFLILKMLV